MSIFSKFRTQSRPRYKLATARPRSTRGILTTGRRLRTAVSNRSVANESLLTPRAGTKRSRPRPVGKHWQSKPALIVYEGGREVCNLTKAEGRGEYRLRVFLMWLRQDGWCCNCGYRLKLSEATFEHEDGRTKARRDDRIAIFTDDGHFVRHINGASHPHCNCKRGSRRTEIFHGNNCYIEKEAA